MPDATIPKKPFWKSKTVWFNLLAGIAALGTLPLGGVVSAALVAKIGAAAAAANIALRIATKQPLSTGGDGQ